MTISPVRIICLIASGSLMFSLGRILVARYTDSNSSIVVNPLVLDFGRVAVNEPAQLAFSLQNVGSRELVIKQIKSSCACVVPQTFESIVSPGASEIVEVILTAKSAGSKAPNVVVETNDPVHPMSVVRIKAEALVSMQSGRDVGLLGVSRNDK